MFARIKAWFRRHRSGKPEHRVEHEQPVPTTVRATSSFIIRSRDMGSGSSKISKIIKPLPNMCPICGTRSTINHIIFERNADGKYKCKICGYVA